MLGVFFLTANCPTAKNPRAAQSIMQLVAVAADRGLLSRAAIFQP